MFAAACGGDDDPGDAAGVFPGEGFIGRTLTVEVVGDTTNWAAGSTLNFGADVTVNSVTVVSPQALQADITINATAAAGLTDVTVTSGGDTFTIPQAFELQKPLTAEVLTFEQGGFGLITLTNLDLLHPFDASTDENTGAFTGTSLTIDGADGVDMQVVDVTDSTVTLSALIDVKATSTGTLTLTSNGPDGMPITSPIDTVAVAPRTPQVITAGSAADFTVAENGSLFEVTASAAGLLNLRMTTLDTTSAGCPTFVVLPTSGKFSDLLVVHQNFGDINADAALDNREVAAGDKFFIVAFEGSGFFCGAPGYPATFNSKEISLTGATAVVDTGDNGTPALAQATTGTLVELTGTLTDAADVDCVKLPMVANKKLHVYTTDEDGLTDSIVTITDTNATTSVADSTDADFGEELVTDALVPASATGRFVCIGASTFVADDFANGPYHAVIVVE